MKRSLNKQLFRILFITLGFELLVFFVFLFSGAPDVVMKNEILKLQTPVYSRAEELQHSLQKFRMNVDVSSLSITALLAANADLPAVERQADSMPLLLELLERSEATGMFIVFGDLSDRPDQREMLYLRDMKPEKPDSTYEDIKIERGRSELTKTFGIPNTSVWQSHLVLEDASFYTETLEAVLATGNDRAQNYGRFSGMFRMSKNDYPMLVYTVPIISNDGTVLGVFGAEIMASHLKSLLHVRDIPFATGVYLFTYLDAPDIDPETSMISGGYGDILKYQRTSLTPESFVLHEKELLRIPLTGGVTMVGISKEISLYDANDYFRSQNHWTLICLVDETNFYAAADQTRTMLCLWLGVVIALNIFGMMFTGRQMKRPMDRFSEEMLKLQEDREYIPRTTDISEIDELLAFFARAITDTGQSDTVSADEHATALFAEFIRRTKTLTETEKAIFRLYAEGKEAQEAASITCTSLNTIKTHNRHIYEKLQISSRNELLLYIDLLRKSEMLKEVL
jgi:DNA-binding CsgD family transcriptional regulator